MVDAVQYRYKWTDDIVQSLPIDRFLEVVTVAREKIHEEEVYDLQKASFMAWITLSRGFGYKKSWGALLKELGISPDTKKKPLTAAEKQAAAASALEKAQSIIHLDSRRKQNKDAHKG